MVHTNDPANHGKSEPFKTRTRVFADHDDERILRPFFAYSIFRLLFLCAGHAVDTFNIIWYDTRGRVAGHAVDTFSIIWYDTRGRVAGHVDVCVVSLENKRRYTCKNNTNSTCIVFISRSLRDAENRLL